MALVLADRVRDTTTTTGTGTVTLSGTAPTGYQNFSVVGNGNTTYYTINAGSQWEVGLGTYSSTGPTLARTTVIASSNSGSAVDFAVGTKDVFVTYPAEKSVNYDASDNVGIGTTNPLKRLDISGGGFAFTEAGGASRSVHWGDTTNIYPLLISGDATSGNCFLTFKTNTFGNAGTERMRIDSAGNVGIGTSSPADKLDVNGGMTTGNITARGDGSEGGQIALNNAANSAAVYAFDVDGGGNGRIFTTTNNVNLTLGQLAGTGGIVSFFTAASERMRIDSSGNVGIGTSAPTAKVQVFSDGPPAASGNMNTGMAVASAAGSFAINIGANATGGYTWLNSAYINASSTASPMVFMTGAAERMRIDSSGNLLVGVSSPFSGYGAKQTIYWNAAAEQGITLRSSTDTYNGNPIIFVNASNTTSGFISQSSTTVTYNTSSDVRLKHDIVAAPEASSLIDAMQVRSFKWNADNSEQRYGFVAQELLEVAPEAVSQPEDPEEMMGVDYSKLVPMLVKEIQSLRARVAQLEGN